ncbi:MAG: (d)CMP kinase [Acidimicrobiales bacterium]
MTPVRTVAIDGPAGAGKSTLARALAEHLGLERLDTGAMYRAVAWAALDRGVDLHDQTTLGALARELDIDVAEEVLVNGHDVSSAIRTAVVDDAVSAVAATASVRAAMVERQRQWVARHGGGVVEGRDIGTVVLPDADVKIYLTARTDERARRRAAERGAHGEEAVIGAALARRDTLDTTRATSPLPTVESAPEGAIVIDSTDKDVQSVIEEVLKCL